MQIDLTSVVAILTMAGSIFYFIVAMKGELRSAVAQFGDFKTEIKAELTRFDARIEALASNFDTRLEKIATVLVDLARQEERLNAVDVRANALRSNMDAINERLTVMEHKFIKPDIPKVIRK